jgi:hypothetical protein
MIYGKWRCYAFNLFVKVFYNQKIICLKLFWWLLALMTRHISHISNTPDYNLVIKHLVIGPLEDDSFLVSGPFVTDS